MASRTTDAEARLQTREPTDDLWSLITGAGELPEDAASPVFWLAFLISALAVAFKSPDALTLPQFWAEDAREFFGDQHGRLLPLLFKPYGTYFHLVPRLVAWLASPFPAVWAPTLYCSFAWLGSALGLVSLRQLRLAGVPYALLLAGLILAPTNGEIYGTITNAQWLMQFYFFGSLARLARGDVARAPWLRIGIVLLNGLSGPFSIFAALAGVLLVLGSRVAARLVSGAATIRWSGELTAMVIAASAQVLSIASSDKSNVDGAGPPTLEGALHVLSYTELHAFGAEPVAPWLFWVLFVLLLVAPFSWLRDTGSRYVLLSAYGFAGVTEALVLRKFAGQSHHLAVFQNGDRYYLIIKTLFFWLLALAVWSVAQRRPRMQRALVVLLILAPLPFTWPLLQRPALPDLHWKEQAVQIDQGKRAVIGVAPPPWELIVEARESPH